MVEISKGCFDDLDNVKQCVFRYHLAFYRQGGFPIVVIDRRFLASRFANKQIPVIHKEGEEKFLYEGSFSSSTSVSWICQVLTSSLEKVKLSLHSNFKSCSTSQAFFLPHPLEKATRPFLYCRSR